MANALHDNAPETAEELPKAIVPTTPVIPAADLPAPTRGQLLRVALTKGIPFVAFGFFDNMIMVGEITSPFTAAAVWMKTSVSTQARSSCCAARAEYTVLATCINQVSTLDAV